MIAGRSSWLCHGTMPPGSIVSLRKRSCRSLILAGSFSRSMAASTVSVTPLPACVAGWRTSGFILSAGQLPATAADAPTSVDAAANPAMTTVRPSQRPLVLRWNMLDLLCCAPAGGRPQRCRAWVERGSNGNAEWLSNRYVAAIGRGQRRSQHALDVRRVGWKRVDGLANLAGGDAKFHRESKKVDQLLAGMTHNVRAQDAVAGLV